MNTSIPPTKFSARIFGKRPSQTKQFIEALTAIPWATLWNSALAIGGLFLIVYFSSIGYLPDLESKDITITLAAIAVIGLYLTGVIGLGLILPTLFTKQAEATNKINLIAQALIGISIAALTLASLAYDYKYKNWAWIAIIIVGVAIAILIDSYQRKNLGLREIPIIAINIIFWATWALMVPMLYYVSISSREGQDDYTTIAMLFLFPTVFASISIGLTLIPDAQRGIYRFIAACGTVVLGGLKLEVQHLTPR